MAPPPNSPRPSPPPPPPPRPPLAPFVYEDPKFFGEYRTVATSSVVAIHMAAVPGTDFFVFMERPSDVTTPQIVSKHTQRYV